MSTLKTIVVDDHQPAVEQLVQTINFVCPQVEIIDSLPINQRSLEQIANILPDLVFFDVGSPNFHGVKLLSEWEQDVATPLILTHQENIKYNYSSTNIPVFDFLPKPINPIRLSHVIQRVSDRNQVMKLRGEVKFLNKTLNCYLAPKLGIPTLQGISCLEVSKIVYIEAADNYAVIYLSCNSQVVSSQSLGKLSERLKYYPFQRIHRRFLVNITHIDKYLRGDGGQVIMTNGKHLNVARNRKESLIAKICHSH